VGRLADPPRSHRLRRVYFAEEMLKTRGESFAGKVCVVSGSGNVAQYTVEKLNQLGAKVVTLSDSNGTSTTRTASTPRSWPGHGPQERQARPHQGIRQEVQMPVSRGPEPLAVPCDCAFPSATQNEITAPTPRRWSRTAASLVRRRQHAQHPRGGRRVPREQDPLRPRQGRQRRRRRHLRPRNEPELHAHELDARGSRRAPAPDHGRHPPPSASKPPRNTASPATTSSAPTSPASSRSPTPCSTRAWCSRNGPDRRAEARRDPPRELPVESHPPPPSGGGGIFSGLEQSHSCGPAAGSWVVEPRAYSCIL
jgi:hypothetical protein